MNNNKLINLVNLYGGNNDLIKINNLNLMLDDNNSSTSEYFSNYTNNTNNINLNSEEELEQIINKYKFKINNLAKLY
jgi:hypothetical protein